MAKPKVIVTRRWHPDVEQVLVERFDTRLNEDDHPMSVAELQDALRAADAVLPTVSDKVTAEVLGADNIRAKILGSNGVGFNHIDLDAAKAAGLTVTNTPEVLTDCTADLAMALLLAVARRVGEGERHLRNGEWTGWRPTHMMGTSVTGKTLGLIGMGRIARAVAARAAHGFNMKIIYHDPFPPRDEDIAGLNATLCASPQAVFAQADFVSLHCPGGKETYHLISTDAFKAMKPGAFLINTARGDVVDEVALISALENGEIAGAGLDVFEKEPAVTPGLLKMENVVLLPHLGSATQETRKAMGMRVVENIEAFFNGETPRDKLV
ncbi:MAG: D-glycerate dehydrogenase [Gammaproteobacteria bacterium]|nr:D-glycerate dehydrogenase [Gammaproteobacteria bacterium]MDH3536341.1 D-glycerate dehydrogenase [Gammaproteobacteria bacterium]